MNDGWLVVLGMVLGTVVLFIVERRRRKRERREHNFTRFRWRADDRDRAVHFGREIFAKTGDPYLDPESYDSTWEYAQAVRAHCEISRDLCEIEIATSTVEHDGMRHRVAKLVIEELSTPTLLCNPDLLQSRVNRDDRPVTCLRCLMKEQDGGGG